MNKKYYRKHSKEINWSPISVWSWADNYKPDLVNSFEKSGYLYRFLVKNKEFDTKEFIDYCIGYNKADCDSGELSSVAKHEVLRLAYEFIERKHRHPNCYYNDSIWDDS